LPVLSKAEGKKMRLYLKKKRNPEIMQHQEKADGQKPTGWCCNE